MQELVEKDIILSSYLNNNDLDINVTSKNIYQNPIILKDKVDENYKFYNKNIFFKFFSILLHCFALIIFSIHNFFVLGVKVKGRKNLKGIKNAVFIANHTFMIDCVALTTGVFKFKRPIFFVDKHSFQIPVAKTIIKCFNGVPIPQNDYKTYKNFIKQTDAEIKKGKSLLIFPEGSMWPYYAKIRPFNSGAYRFSIKNNIPIIPIVFSFRKPNKIQKFFGKKKPQININILQPYYPNLNNSLKNEEERLNKLIQSEMQKSFFENNSYIYIV